MKKLSLVLIGGIAALALLAGIGDDISLRRYLRAGRDGVPEAASHRLGRQERLGKMRRCHRRHGRLAVAARLGLCRHAYVRQRSHPDDWAAHCADIGHPSSARLPAIRDVDGSPYFGKHQTMKECPVSIVAALIGDPARANMLMALMSGLALSGTELAAEAGVTLSTASTPRQARGPAWSRRPSRVEPAISVADPDVAAAVEGLIPIATASAICAAVRPARPGDAPGALVLRPSRRAAGGCLA